MIPNSSSVNNSPSSASPRPSPSKSRQTRISLKLSSKASTTPSEFESYSESAAKPRCASPLIKFPPNNSEMSSIRPSPPRSTAKIPSSAATQPVRSAKKSSSKSKNALDWLSRIVSMPSPSRSRISGSPSKNHVNPFTKVVN